LTGGEAERTAIRFTALVGSPVRDAGGRRLGRVTDFGIRLAEIPPPVELAVFRHGWARFAVEWSEVEGFKRGGVLGLRAGARILPAPSTADAVLLTQALLDTQVVDLAGKRVARVGDVQLAASDGGLHVVALEVGVDAVLRRLGLTWLARRVRPQTLPWTDVHLASPRGHVLQLEAPTAAIHRLTVDELVELVGRLPPPRADEVLSRVPAARQAKTAARSGARRRYRFRLIRRGPS
jgi:sporulation protein YlmC with PRC-barrel domain